MEITYQKLRAMVFVLFSLNLISLSAIAQDDALLELGLEELLQIELKKIALLNRPHTHGQGELMVSYHYMGMKMQDHLSGTSELSTSDVLNDFMVTPTKMNMTMHMLNLMYAPSSRITLMVMGQYLVNSMDHEMRNGNTFTTESSGLGDTQLSVLYSLFSRNRGKLVASLNLSIPTGSIDNMGVTPMSAPNEVQLPYPMQLGSGTWDPGLALTYFKVTNGNGWGLDARNTFRLMDNDRDYHLGNLFNATAWYSRIWSDQFSTSLSLDLNSLSNIEGADADLNPMMVYTANPDLRAGDAILGGLTMTYRFQNQLEGLRLAVEGKLPLYQNLDGPQLSLDNRFKIALTHVFKLN